MCLHYTVFCCTDQAKQILIKAFPQSCRIRPRPPGTRLHSLTASGRRVEQKDTATGPSRRTSAGSSATSNTTAPDIHANSERKKSGNTCPTSPRSETWPPRRKTRPSTPFCFCTATWIGPRPDVYPIPTRDESLRSAASPRRNEAGARATRTRCEVCLYI